MKIETFYHELLRRETEEQARRLYERECGDLEAWEHQPDTLRDVYRTRVRVAPLFAS